MTQACWWPSARAPNSFETVFFWRSLVDHARDGKVAAKRGDSTMFGRLNKEACAKRASPCRRAARRHRRLDGEARSPQDRPRTGSKSSGRRAASPARSSKARGMKPVDRDLSAMKKVVRRYHLRQSGQGDAAKAAASARCFLRSLRIIRRQGQPASLQRSPEIATRHLNFVNLKILILRRRVPEQAECRRGP